MGRPAVLLVLACLPAAAAAQTVQGRVLDDREETPVSGAEVVLADTGGQVLRRAFSDGNGAFWLWHTAGGEYRLSVAALGYATVEAQPVRLDSARVVEVELRLQPDAVPLEPLRVITRREVQRFTPDEFYDRMSRLTDRGEFVTREEIEASRAGLPSEVIRRVPGTVVRSEGRSVFTNTVSLMSYGRRCRPLVYLDGQKMPEGEIDNWVSVDQIEGIEVYRGGFAPDNYAREPASWQCGMILVWRRTEVQERFVFTWGRTLLFGALGAFVLGASFLF